jgi:hypothetical protein
VASGKRLRRGARPATARETPPTHTNACAWTRHFAGSEWWCAGRGRSSGVLTCTSGEQFLTASAVKRCVQSRRLRYVHVILRHWRNQACVSADA